jgi:hypothetical protein
MKPGNRKLEGSTPKLGHHPVLRDVQPALAREYGLENWKELKLAAEKPKGSAVERVCPLPSTVPPTPGMLPGEFVVPNENLCMSTVACTKVKAKSTPS